MTNKDKILLGLLALCLAIPFVFKQYNVAEKTTTVINKQTSDTMDKNEAGIDTIGIITGENNVAVREYADNFNTAIGYKAVWDTNFFYYNIIIGEGAGRYLSSESYCVIVGHDSTAVNMKGNHLLWYVDYSEPYLSEDISKILKNYEETVINKNLDNIERRSELWHLIQKTIRP